jgi:hypothetical protein
MKAIIILLVLLAASVAITGKSAYATSKNNSAIEACFNSSATRLTTQFMTEIAQNGGSIPISGAKPFDLNHPLILALQQVLVECLTQNNK